MPARKDAEKIAAEIKRLKAEGNSHDQIGKKLRVSKPTIIKALRGEWPAPKKETGATPSKKTKTPPTEESTETATETAPETTDELRLIEQDPPRRAAPKKPDAKPATPSEEKPATPTVRRYDLVF